MAKQKGASRIDSYMKDLLEPQWENFPKYQEEIQALDISSCQNISIAVDTPWKLDGLDNYCLEIFQRLSLMVENLSSMELEDSSKTQAFELASSIQSLTEHIDVHLKLAPELYREEDHQHFYEAFMKALNTIAGNKSCDLYTIFQHGSCPLTLQSTCHLRCHTIEWSCHLSDKHKRNALGSLSQNDFETMPRTSLHQIASVFLEHPGALKCNEKALYQCHGNQRKLPPLTAVLSTLVSTLGHNFWAMFNATVCTLCDQEKYPKWTEWGNGPITEDTIAFAERLWMLIGQVVRMQLFHRDEATCKQNGGLSSNWELVGSLLHASPFAPDTLPQDNVEVLQAKYYAIAILERCCALAQHWMPEPLPDSSTTGHKQGLVVHVFQKAQIFWGSELFDFQSGQLGVKDTEMFLQQIKEQQGDEIMFVLFMLTIKSYGACRMPRELFQQDLLQGLKEFKAQNDIERRILALAIFFIQIYLKRIPKKIVAKRALIDIFKETNKTIASPPQDKLFSEKQVLPPGLSAFFFTVTLHVTLIRSGCEELSTFQKTLPKVQWLNTQVPEKALVIFLQGVLLVAVHFSTQEMDTDNCSTLNEWVAQWLKLCFEKALSIFMSTDQETGNSNDSYFHRSMNLCGLGLGILLIWTKRLLALKLPISDLYGLFQKLFKPLEGFSEKIGILKNKLCSDIFLSFVEHILPPVIAENRVTMTDSAAATTMLKGASSNQNIEDDDDFDWDFACATSDIMVERNLYKQNKDTVKQGLQVVTDLVQKLFRQGWLQSPSCLETGKVQDQVMLFSSHSIGVFTQAMAYMCDTEKWRAVQNSGWKTMRNEVFLKMSDSSAPSNLVSEDHHHVSNFVKSCLLIQDFSQDFIAGKEMEILLVWLRAILEPSNFPLPFTDATADNQSFPGGKHPFFGSLLFFTCKLEVALESSTSIFKRAFSNTPKNWNELLGGLHSTEMKVVIFLLGYMQSLAITLQERWESSRKKPTQDRLHIENLLSNFTLILTTIYNEHSIKESNDSLYAEYLYATTDLILRCCGEPLKHTLSKRPNLVTVLFQPLSLQDHALQLQASRPIMMHYLAGLLCCFSQLSYTINPVYEYIQHLEALVLLDHDHNKDVSWKKSLADSLICPENYFLSNEPQVLMQDQNQQAVLTSRVRSFVRISGLHNLVYQKEALHDFRSRLLSNQLRRFYYERLDQEALVFAELVFAGINCSGPLQRKCMCCQKYSVFQEESVQYLSKICLENYKAALCDTKNTNSRLLELCLQTIQSLNKWVLKYDIKSKLCLIPWRLIYAISLLLYPHLSKCDILSLKQQYCEQEKELFAGHFYVEDRIIQTIKPDIKAENDDLLQAETLLINLLTAQSTMHKEFAGTNFGRSSHDNDSLKMSDERRRIIQNINKLWENQCKLFGLPNHPSSKPNDQK